MEELEPKEGISRRKMMKRIGAGAAIAWTAPILTSIRTPAFAYGPPPPGCSTNDNCGCVTPCEAAIPCNGNPLCNCWVASADNGSVCLCRNFVAFCGETPLCPNGQSDCDAIPGAGCCVQTCCGQICAQTACTGTGSRKVHGGQRTTR